MIYQNGIFRSYHNGILRYENSEREADYEALIKFADYFNVSLDYLLGRTKNK